MDLRKACRVLLFVLSVLGFVLPLSAQDLIDDEDRAKLIVADKLAAQFVERFRQTQDFATVWREFRSSDSSCAIRLTPVLPAFTGGELSSKSFPKRLRELGFNERRLTRFHIAYWNSALLFQSYIYSVTPSKNGSEPDFEGLLASKHVPAGARKIASLVRKILKKEELREQGKSRSKTLIDYDEILTNSNAVAAIVRKYMPKNALRSANWFSAVKWWSDVHSVSQVRERADSAGWCSAGTGKVYIAQIGFFVFRIIEENNRLRLWSMSYAD